MAGVENKGLAVQLTEQVLDRGIGDDLTMIDDRNVAAEALGLLKIMRRQNNRGARRIDLFEEMFGEKNTLWDHLDRMSDTPIAEEVYGG